MDYNRNAFLATEPGGNPLCGEAPAKVPHRSECDAEQLRGIKGGELTGKEAGQELGAALLSRAQS